MWLMVGPWTDTETEEIHGWYCGIGGLSYFLIYSTGTEKNERETYGVTQIRTSFAETL